MKDNKLKVYKDPTNKLNRRVMMQIESKINNNKLSNNKLTRNNVSKTT